MGGALRLNSVLPYFDNVPHTLFFTLLSFIGSAPWDVVCETAIGRFLVFVAFLVFVWVLSSSLMAFVASEVMNALHGTATYISNRWSSASKSISSRFQAKLENDQNRSWLKEHLPGWYYRVTAPNRNFRNRVKGEEEAESKRKLSELEISPSHAVISNNPEVYASLNQVSENLFSQLGAIRLGIKNEMNVLEERLREVNSLLIDITDHLIVN